jgi:cytochrome c oxidase cbb3-type subunit 1
MKYGPEIILSALLSFIAFLGAAFAVDEPFRLHMWITFFVIAAFTVGLMRNTSFEPQAPVDESTYMDGPIRYGVIATVFWGVVGFLVGAVIAAQLAFPDINFEPWLNFGRARPLHTSAVIFAFGGNILIASSF